MQITSKIPKRDGLKIAPLTISFLWNNKVILKHSDITYVGIDTPYNMFTFTIYYITKKR